MKWYELRFVYFLFVICCTRRLREDNSIFVHHLLEWRKKEGEGCLSFLAAFAVLRSAVRCPCFALHVASPASADLISAEKDGLQSPSFHVDAAVFMIIRLRKCATREIKCNDCRSALSPVGKDVASAFWHRVTDAPAVSPLPH